MEYNSNVNIVFQKLGSKLNSVNKSNVIQREIATYLLQDNLWRVHNEGKAVDGTSIGSYSTKPTLIGAKSFTKKSAANKAFAEIKRQHKKGQKISKALSKWRTIKKGDKAYHLAILNGGYKYIRQLEGKETNYVNLQRTSKLKLDLKMQADGNDYIIGFISEYGAKISTAQEKHWKKAIWGVTKANYDKIYNEIIPNIIKRA